MSRKTQPKIRSLGATSTPGQYGFDNGSVAFSDPMELLGKKAKAREQARIRWKTQGNKKRAYRSSKSDFHRKHG